jgi:ADP-heptose:LPS heptosyltransferase
MHIITVPTRIDMSPLAVMESGEYLVEDRNTGEIMIQCPGVTAVNYPAPTIGTENPAFGWRETVNNILLVAPVGFGDAILLTPCLRAIKQLHPNASLAIATVSDRRQVFLGLPYVDGFEDYPVATSQLSNYDCVLFLERALEHNDRAKVQHMTDRFAEHLGLDELKDKFPDYGVSQMERDWVQASFPRTAKKRIGIQIQTGARCRSYPRMSLLVEAFRREKWEVFMMGAPGEFYRTGPAQADVTDLSRRGLTWRQSAAALLTCDVFLGADSSLLHAAGALNVPAVGLFGPYPWKLRTAYYKSVHAIQGKDGCDLAPCFHASHLGTPVFPPAGPCNQTGNCVVLDSILPKKIMALCERLATASARLGEHGVPLEGQTSHLEAEMSAPDPAGPESPS